MIGRLILCIQDKYFLRETCIAVAVLATDVEHRQDAGSLHVGSPLELQQSPRRENLSACFHTHEHYNPAGNTCFPFINPPDTALRVILLMSPQSCEACALLIS